MNINIQPLNAMSKYRKTLIACNKLILDCVLGNRYEHYQPNLILGFFFLFFPLLQAMSYACCQQTTNPTGMTHMCKIKYIWFCKIRALLKPIKW